MQSKFSFYAHQLQGGASFGHTIDPKLCENAPPKSGKPLKTTRKSRAFMRGFPERDAKSVFAFPTEECETNQEPLIMSVSLE